jgi:hypothetical protein
LKNSGDIKKSTPENKEALSNPDFFSIETIDEGNSSKLPNNDILSRKSPAEQIEDKDQPEMELLKSSSSSSDQINECNDRFGLCIEEVRKRVVEMQWSKEKARSMLLGEQWFIGRTGFNVNTKTVNEEEKEQAVLTQIHCE